MLFKGGTSLSKAYGLISRFSEDIDITVFREDIGQNVEVGDLEGLSGKQQRVRLDAIKQACRTYVLGQLKDRLNGKIETHFRAAQITFATAPVAHDHDDPDQQTLLLHYPTVIPGADDYVKPSVKIDAGARSALDPHRSTSIEPYVAGDMADSNFIVQGVVTIDAERTLWDKIVILHGLRRWHDSRGALRQNGHRISRHYYDIHQLIHSPLGQGALSDRALAADCTRHALMFFTVRIWTCGMLSLAHTGSCRQRKWLTHLNDYQAMAGMIFGEVPNFMEILETVRQLELVINGAV